MALTLSCECGQTFETSKANAGCRVSCPGCERDLMVPKARSYRAVDDFEVQARAASRTSGVAVLSLVLGILAFPFGVAAGLPAIILGSLGLGEIKRGKGRVKGRRLAIAGNASGLLGCNTGWVLILAWMFIGGFQIERETARRARCVKNLEQLALAMHKYESAKGTFPPQAITDRDGRPLLIWRVALLPYLGQDSLYRKFHLNEPWHGPHNKPLLEAMPALFRCPTDSLPPGMTTYQGVVGKETMFPEPQSSNPTVRLADVTDGTANTLFFSETKFTVPWTAPQDLPFELTVQTTQLGSSHGGGFNAAFVDGSVRFLKNA